MKIDYKHYAWLLTLWGIFLGVLISTLYYSSVREFDRDEFEHIHTSWKILQGQEIYVDFFQNHHPLLNYLLTPIIYYFGDNTTAIFACRYLIILMLIGISIVIFFLSLRVFKGTDVGIMSLILTLTMVTFYSKAIEVRPDVPQTLFGLLSIYYLYVYYDKRSMASLTASALFLGVSFLFLQKTFILCLILGVLLIYDLYRKQMPFRHVLFYIVIFITCISPFYIYHLVNESIREYFVMNWTFNVKTSQEFSKWRYIILTIRENIITCTLFLVGILTLMRAKNTTYDQRRFGIISMGLILSLIIFGNPWRQYLMMAIPTIGIISSFALNSTFNNKLTKLIVLIGAIYIPISIMHGHGLFKRTDVDQKNQLRKLEYVLSITKQDDRVYDGNIKFNLFRDDIDFFWLCISKSACVGPYKTIANYDYDIYELIYKHKPKVISNFGIDNLDDPKIKDFYEVSDKYNSVLIRVR